MGVRRTLGTRTLFNLLGPLANPAQPEVQVMGIYAAHLVRPAAETLALLGCEAALVVHGSGLDEIALHGPTTAARLAAGVVEDVVLTPEEAGLPRAPVEALRAGEPAAAAGWLADLLAGRGDRVHTDTVALNAGALLWIAGRCATLRAGAERAREILASGSALERLQALVELSHGD
jgi:anthranilate phosphoribosyltransferase